MRYTFFGNRAISNIITNVYAGDMIAFKFYILN